MDNDTGTNQNQDTPAQTGTEDGGALQSAQALCKLANGAADNPQTSAPLRALVPMLVALLIEHADKLAQHEARIFELGN